MFLTICNWYDLLNLLLVADPPGPIDNSRIMTWRGGGYQLRPSADYGQLSPDMWAFLHNIYGGGPAALIRQRTVSASQSHTTQQSSSPPKSGRTLILPSSFLSQYYGRGPLVPRCLSCPFLLSLKKTKLYLISVIHQQCQPPVLNWPADFIATQISWDAYLWDLHFQVCFHLATLILWSSSYPHK